MSFFRVSIIVLSVCLLSGCGVRFVYNQLDWLIPWYLDDYMELEGDQEALFDEKLEHYLAWHRSQQLPLYADFLNKIADEAESGLTRQDVNEVQVRSEEFAQVLVNKMKPDLLALFATASDEQVNQLFKKLAKDNVRFHKEYVDVDEQKQRRQWQSEVERYVERWTGGLNDQQLQLIADWSKDFELMGTDLEQSRLAWQAEFKRILSLRKDRDGYEKAFLSLLDNPQFGQSDAMKARLDRNGEKLVDLYLAVDKTLTEKQRRKAVAKLRDYANDFIVLAKQ